MKKFNADPEENSSEEEFISISLKYSYKKKKPVSILSKEFPKGKNDFSGFGNNFHVKNASTNLQ
jgi:hypothetical protein